MSNVNSADFRDKYLGRIWTDSFRNSIEMLPTLSSIQRAIFGFHRTRNTSRKLRPKYGRSTRRAFKVLLTAHPSMQTLNGWKRMYHPAQNPAIGKAMKMSSISHRMENRILTTAFESAISAAEIKGNKCTNKLIPSFHSSSRFHSIARCRRMPKFQHRCPLFTVLVMCEDTRLHLRQQLTAVFT